MSGLPLEAEKHITCRADKPELLAGEKTKAKNQTAADVDGQEDWLTSTDTVAGQRGWMFLCHQIR